MRAATVMLGLAVVALACAPRETEVADTSTAITSAQDTAAQGGEWAPAPGLPPGAQVMVVSGDPTQAGPFTARLRFPDDYRVPPHTHPAEETVTTVSGLLHWARGSTFSMQGMAELRPGQSATIPANDPHYAHAAGETVIEVRSTGPFRIDMVDTTIAVTR